MKPTEALPPARVTAVEEGLTRKSKIIVFVRIGCEVSMSTSVAVVRKTSSMIPAELFCISLAGRASTVTSP